MATTVTTEKRQFCLAPAYHGTAWPDHDGLVELLADGGDLSAHAFVTPEPSKTSDDAIFFTPSEHLAEFFAYAAASERKGISVILRGSLVLKEALVISGGNSCFFLTESYSFETPEGQRFENILEHEPRRELFRQLINLGYAGYVPEEHQNSHHGIASFDAKAFEADGVRLRLRDDSWSEWMGLSAAKELYRKLLMENCSRHSSRGARLERKR